MRKPNYVRTKKVKTLLQLLKSVSANDDVLILVVKIKSPITLEVLMLVKETKISTSKMHCIVQRVSEIYYEP